MEKLLFRFNMIFFRKYLETIILATLAIILLFIGISSYLYTYPFNTIYFFTPLVSRGEILNYILLIYSSGFGFLTIVSYFMIRFRNRAFFVHCFLQLTYALKEFTESSRRFFKKKEIYNSLPWLAIIIIIGVAVRSFFLNQPIRYDEGYTFLEFVNSNFSNLFYYPLPNNHVLHTILVRISVEILGSHPPAMRVPALLAGLLNIPLTFFITKKLTGEKNNGYFAAALVAIFPYLILYDTMARGYSILVLLTLFLIALSLKIIKHPSIRLSSLIGLVIALGLFDMPSFLFPATGILLWIFFIFIIRGYGVIWSLLKVMVPCILMTILFTGILYTPVVFASNGINSIINNRYVQSQPFQKFLNELPHHIALIAKYFCRDIPNLGVLLLLIFFVIGLYITAKKHQWTFFMLPSAIICGGIIILLIKHAIPPQRTWIYILPITFIMMDEGFIAIANYLSSYFKKLSFLHIKLVLIFFASYAALLIINNNLILSYPDSGRFLEAPVVVDVLSNKMKQDDRLITRPSNNSPIHFYMWYKNVPSGKSTNNRGKRYFFVVKPSLYSIEDLTTLHKNRLYKLLDYKDAKLFMTK